MSSSFVFDHPDHVAAGAVGPLGERVFYLQARENGEVVSLRLEKQQVAALCDYLAGILADLPLRGHQPGAPADDDAAAVTDVELIEPVVPEWVVGALAVAYEEIDDRILLVAEEFVPEPEGDDDETPTLDALDALDALGEAPDAATARFRLTRAQVLAMVTHAAGVVAAGRPICQVCGRPMDPAGHFCPRNN